VDQEVKAGFAVGANLQATVVPGLVCKSHVQDTAQAIASSSFGYPLLTVPSVDAQTSQTNIVDLMSSQSSPEELNAAYSRVETRCAQSLSRSPSPCISQYSNYSNCSSECPTPTSPTFGENPFASPIISCQDQSQDFGFGPYNGGPASPTKDIAQGMTELWGWGNQVDQQSYNSYQPSIGRSTSCRW
jgi:hypothetical protein